jgi:hypothetical protein
MIDRIPLPSQEAWTEYELWIAEVDRDRPTLLSPHCHPKQAVDASHEALRQHLIATRALATGGAREVIDWAEEACARSAAEHERERSAPPAPRPRAAPRAYIARRPPRGPRTPRQGSLSHLTPAEKRERKLAQTRLSNARKREERKASKSQRNAAT